MTAIFSKTSKIGTFLLLVAMSFCASADFNRGAHLNNRGQGKVNKALARGYMQGKGSSMQQSQVNIGSKRAGTCTMNIGTTNDKNAKEVIVTTKEIINVCR
jgi:hypothetical protein